MIISDPPEDENEIERLERIYDRSTLAEQEREDMKKQFADEPEYHPGY